MARTASKVQSLVKEDAEMEEALEYVLETADEGSVSWGDVSDELTSGQWGRLIEKGILVDSDGEGFDVDDPDGVREALEDDDLEFPDPPDADSSWTKWDKGAAVGSVAMFAGYMFDSVREPLADALNLLLGPLLDLLPFFAVVMVLALFTGLYSTLLQSNLMDMEVMGKYQGRMKEIQERRKEAKERGDDEALERIQEEQMEAMADNLGMFKEQFRPMVWIMLLTIPVFLWMYAVVGFRGAPLYPEIELVPVVMPIAGEVDWTHGLLGPIQVWIVWYFVCSMCFTQVLRKALNIQTTPT
ncbi:DUF106 family protein [Natronomonas pharaonis DSM 2160]|uniref:DUF106 family protein n=1 Tax=Natronomonas pharaonis (strain ATCC 35678 / DSM 2160 / CIP 103997 / JCM 8858 / NBRC 14720 / NCIMB 2260 / Gabara) TaxID=348780 RepID=A0A1U7EZ40_NATPD|nr:DUF106 domain-containing protein [Natronomonas pharaonis]CAI50547.1 DUF106 family protein [Natronomonas pharaonis DSM 2160]